MSKAILSLFRNAYTLLEDIYKISMNLGQKRKVIFIPDGTVCKKYGLRPLYFDGEAAPGCFIH